MSDDSVQISISEDSLWVRHSNYCIQDGCIARASDSTPERFSPVALYTPVMDQYRTVQTPYADLLELGRKLKRNAPNQHPNELILAWVQRYGLLGILPATAMSIRLATRWRPEKTGGSLLHPAQLRYVRNGGTWGGRWYMNVGETVVGDDFRGQVVHADRLANDWPQPGVLQWDWSEMSIREKSLDSISEFFPNQRTPNYPLPLSDEFFECYSEPLRMFTHWAVWFFDQALAVSDFYKGTIKEETAQRALHQLASLANQSGSVFAYSNRRAPTLLKCDSVRPLVSTLGSMLLRDLVETGRKILLCEVCESVFVSDEMRAKYCTPKCRNTAQVRRSRLVRKQKSSSTEGF